MLTHVLIGAAHLLGFGLGLGSVFARGRALRHHVAARLAGDRASADANLGRALFADNFWGLAALLWLGTGLPRAFLGLGKGTAFYLHNGAFLAKMGVFAVVFLLELWPMVTLIRWRIQQQRGQTLDTSAAGAIATISGVQTVLVVVLLVLAVGMARGLWMFA
jgi:putative membrane protein